MPQPAAHKRIIFYGALLQAVGGGAEIYSFSMASQSEESDSDLAQALDPGMQGNMANGALQISSHAVHQGTRVESVDAAGKVTSSYNVSNSAGAQGLNQELLLTICCQAVTLETGDLDEKGRKVRGRIYPPAMASSPVGSTTSASDTTAYNTAWGTFLASLNDIGAAIAVASTTSAGLVAVTGTSVDNVVDTQRRRKNQVQSVRSPIHSF